MKSMSYLASKARSGMWSSLHSAASSPAFPQPLDIAHYMIQQKWPLQMICGQFFAVSSFNFADLCPRQVEPIVYYLSLYMWACVLSMQKWAYFLILINRQLCCANSFAQ